MVILSDANSQASFDLKDPLPDEWNTGARSVVDTSVYQILQNTVTFTGRIE
ncbi:hypothetical protein [Algoriphagus antarcticus]|uniref:Uncharacterized protein n=1 Tax=Algoriphagus antarcticus TaxID=238540 RepID=A0A3E0DYC0_9BACT|nr:hypothetical protein [Algoriphagus antarcticus]REG90951.1 hypothetical protein C8N25_10559 [Algoriphagus antarcticus]